jgi:hypothetical protein
VSPSTPPAQGRQPSAADIYAAPALQPAGSLREAPLRDLWTLLTVLLVVAAGVLMLATLRDYGITFDERDHAGYAYDIMQWYKSRFRDRSAIDRGMWVWLGGFFDVLAHVTAKIVRKDIFQVRHALGVAFALGGVVYTARLGALLDGPRSGFLAAVALLLIPAFYGHAFNNPKDIPIAALFVVALFYTVRAVPRMPRITWQDIGLLGGAIGLALGIRIISLSLLVYLGLAFVLAALLRARASARPGDVTPATPRSAAASLLGDVLAFAPRAVAVGLIAYAVMIVWWPAAQVSPVKHILRTLEVTQHHMYKEPVLFEGREWLPGELPRYYVTKLLAMTLPEVILIALGVAAVRAAIVLARRRPLSRVQIVGWSVLIFAVVFPIAYQALKRAPVYDSWRQFLFIAPLLAIVAGSAVSWMVGQARTRRWMWLPVGALGALALTTASDMVRLHPYQTIYFNRAIAGGLATAAQRYDTDYWGNSYKEGVAWLQREYRPDASPRSIPVVSCGDPASTDYFLKAPRFVFAGVAVAPKQAPEILLATPRWGCDRKFAGDTLHVVRRMGADLLYVKKVR